MSYLIKMLSIKWVLLMTFFTYTLLPWDENYVASGLCLALYDIITLGPYSTSVFSIIYTN